MLGFLKAIQTEMYSIFTFHSHLGLNDLRSAAVLCLILVSVFVTSIYAQEVDETDRAVALFNKGQVEHSKGNISEAIESYKAAVSIIEKFPEAEFQLATAYRQRGEKELAERSFRRAVEFREDWSLARSGLGSFLVDLGRYSEAEVHLLKAIELDEQNFPAYAALSELRIRTSADPSELRSLYAKVAELSEKAKPPVSIWIARGSLELALGERKAASASYSRAMTVDGKNVVVVRELALIAILDGDATRANGLINKLATVSGNDPSVPVLRARVLLVEGKNEEAEVLLAAIKDQTPEIRALREKIAATMSTDVAAFEKAVADDPGNISAIARLCVLYRKDDPARSLEFCKKANELEPDNINHAIGYGAALVKAQNYAAAIVLMRRLVESAPENSTVRANLATALFHSKRYAEAKSEYNWLVEKQPKLAVAYFYLGIVHDQLGEYLDAAANYQQFLRLAEADVNKLEIEKVNLRMPILQKQIKNKKGK